MNEKIKKLWVDALRSGEYEQTRFFLKDDNGYCCLGVLVDVCIKNGFVKGEWDGGSYSSPLDYESKAIPSDVAEVCEFSKGVARRIGNAYNIEVWYPMSSSPYPYLSQLNDETMITFNEIADIIEEQL